MVYCLDLMGQDQNLFLRFSELENVHLFTPLIEQDSSKAIEIRVNSQQEFDLMNESITSKLKGGYTKVKIVISSGIFYYDNDHIFLNRVDYPKASISIEGKNTMLYGRHSICENCKNEKQIGTEYEQIKPRRSKMYQLDSPIDIVDMDSNICRIPNRFSLQYQEGLIIELTEWYQRKKYSIVKITNEYIYFKAKRLTYRDDWKSFSVNLDYAMAKQYPRFRFILPSDSTIEDASIPSRFMWIFASTLNQVNISNIHFVGSSDKQESLLYISYSKCKRFEIRSCRFEGLANEAVRGVCSDNLCFHDNMVENCEGGVLLTDNSSHNTRVENNVFNRTGLNGGMNYTVTCYGSDFTIQGNIFKDFNYTAINSGMRLNWDKPFSCNGIIEGNELFYTPNFIKTKSQYTLIDGGAIYLDSKIDHIIVRYNYIHDYTGMGHNRGVYCDDGAGNIDIYGNIIVNISNGDALFSWRSKGAEKQYRSANNNINVMYNIIQGTYKFESTDINSCMIGRNVVMEANGQETNKSENFRVIVPNIIDSNKFKVHNGELILSKRTKENVRELPCYNGMKVWIR